MNCGFRSLYAYTQSDEISVLFHPEITTFDRKVRKYNSVLAGEASAKFSLLLGGHACFDCRISELPGVVLWPETCGTYMDDFGSSALLVQANLVKAYN
ncbi:MAG: hypothetical protein JO033_21995, partial [Acidobacteriaceae bacterium]|nr:hypothetical protein [Acidobacteriaceae bacterium]